MSEAGYIIHNRKAIHLSACIVQNPKGYPYSSVGTYAGIPGLIIIKN